ncbi:MAG: PSD1 and planctomycete cytochrome C domain-containing protein [Planctomycetales bacterium]
MRCLRALWSLLALAPIVAAAADVEPVDFTRTIRPILSDACFLCHGPDADGRKADLRLDTKDGALGAAGAPGVFVPGKPDESEALRRMLSDDPEERMPPPASGKSLTPAQIEVVRRWVAQGAKWSTHWAFQTPQRPAVPALSGSGPARNAIDHFIRARLATEGLSPSPDADRETLIRRLSLDLVGLPPTVAEVDAFLADADPRAYENLVDRLLASPHYGERWGRLWLDAARYADSDGYEKDKPRFTWAYRDWVVNAFNRDLPYDQFVIEQIAGDQLPQPTQDQLVATGFLRNSMLNEEGGVDPEQFRMEAMFDRMDAIGKSMLGLTIQCAQCHSHKYDPITQEDYYRMFAFINNSHEANVAVYAPDELSLRAELFRKMQEIESDLQHRHPDWPARLAAWEDSVRDNQPQWKIIQAAEDDTSGGQKMYRLPDGSYLCQGYAPTKHTVTVSAQTDLQNITAIRLEQLNDPNLPLGGPGRSIKGTSALTEFRAKAYPVGKPDQSVAITFVRATADANPPERPLEAIYADKTDKKRVTGPVEMAIDGKDETAWSIDLGPGRRNVPRKAVFVADKPFSFPEGTVVEVQLAQNHGGWNSDDNQNHNLGRFRLSVTSAADPMADPLPAEVRRILAIPRAERTPPQVAALFSFWRTTVPEWLDANAQMEELWRRHPEGSSQLVLSERQEARTTHMLSRGDFLKPTTPVTPGVPAVLHPFPKDAPPTRLGFAKWLVDPQSPTAARSIVNRVWQTYFGSGLVATSEDLGSQSDAPSHPELLDWLAVEFTDPKDPAGDAPSGKSSPPWSLKRLHRLIVTSSTYRQSSRVSPDLHARDPQNRLLARGARLRVDAEVVRDIALAASGLLDRTLGGPSVHPPAPAFLFLPPASYGPKTWTEETGSNRYRRALYTFRYRSVPYPPLQNFDAPNGDFSCVRRTRSNTPLQALTTLNEPVFLECARGLAQRAWRAGGETDEQRIAFAFRCCVARQPTAQESAALLRLLHRQTLRFGDGKENPWDLAAADPQQPPPLPSGATPAQLAAWTAVSRVLLNLDETITKE